MVRGPKKKANETNEANDDDEGDDDEGDDDDDNDDDENDDDDNDDDAEFIYKAICLDAALRNLEQDYRDTISNLQLEPRLTLLALSNCIWLFKSG